MVDAQVKSAKECLDTIKHHVMLARRKGDFLLSTNEISHAWIYLRELDQQPVRVAIRQILTILLSNFLTAHKGRWTVFSPVYTETSERELQIAIIVEEAVREMESRRLNFRRVEIDRGTRQIIVRGAFHQQGLGMFAISVHIDLIRRILEGLRRRDCNTEMIIAVLEREQRSRKELRDDNIELLPLVIYDEEADTAKSILEMWGTEYRVYHDLFVSV